MSPLVKVVPDTNSSSSDQSRVKLKEPKRILHFSDGTLEEYSTDEETEQVDHSSTNTEVPTDWIPWLWYATTTTGYKTLEICDSVGEYLANFFGITSSKYHAEIEYYKESLKAKENENLSCSTEMGSSRLSVNT